MTEVDLPPHIAAMLAQQAGGVPNPEFEKAQDDFHDAIRRYEREAYAQVQFWGPVLCGCARTYFWGEPEPPQGGCVVHGYVMTDRDTGAVFLFGLPKLW